MGEWRGEASQATGAETRVSEQEARADPQGTEDRIQGALKGGRWAGAAIGRGLGEAGARGRLGRPVLGTGAHPPPQRGRIGPSARGRAHRAEAGAASGVMRQRTMRSGAPRMPTAKEWTFSDQLRELVADLPCLTAMEVTREESRPPERRTPVVARKGRVGTT